VETEVPARRQERVGQDPEKVDGRCWRRIRLCLSILCFGLVYGVYHFFVGVSLNVLGYSFACLHLSCFLWLNKKSGLCSLLHVTLYCLKFQSRLYNRRGVIGSERKRSPYASSKPHPSSPYAGYSPPNSSSSSSCRTT